ncbi:uncharacterized protein RAG0_07470 [Rhynchosporium agropyri]|uniref:Uncharacterized protein n=1 Tax=Rhynchosporium agropyri TaxID=914238 RepID=A0A1E1KLM1_9HELO|nr:uncharacterized protein RAG0_07470 [Rhynchosporium agropyri]
MTSWKSGTKIAARQKSRKASSFCRTFTLEKDSMWNDTLGRKSGKPGRRLHMSIMFSDANNYTHTCPNCKADNQTNQGLPAHCMGCGTHYERFVELLNDEDSSQDHEIGNDFAAGSNSSNKRKRTIIEPDLKLAFSRITLTRQA